MVYTIHEEFIIWLMIEMADEFAFNNNKIRIKASKLYIQFLKFWIASSKQDTPQSITRFGKEFKKLDFVEHKRSNGIQYTITSFYIPFKQLERL
jgi:hypothetical protein